jgi:hypothetical protein
MMIWEPCGSVAVTPVCRDAPPLRRFINPKKTVLANPTYGQDVDHLISREHAAILGEFR